MNISQYIRSFSSVHKKYTKNHKKFLHFSLKRFVELRNERVDDLLSKEIRRSTKIESELFSLGLPKMLLCVDGRVLAKLVASLHEGGIRTPAADNIEFLPSMKGDSLFLSEGRLTQFIKERFSLYESMIFFLDSHLHCAARKASSIDICGHDLKDDGLLDDIVQKKKMADALVGYVEKTFGKKKKIFPIHTSFDPHTGFLFMGLEKEDVLEDSRIVCEGFTEGNLMALSEEKKILSTFLWAQKNGLLFDLFTSFVFELDYEKSYCQSTLQFWENVKKISLHALPRIVKELLAVFPNLSGKKLELRERSVFLLANAYTAFLLNHVKNGYSYAKHDESVIVITPGDRGPYVSFRSFTVDPVNANLSSVLKFIEGLIRSNRAERRCSREERGVIDTLFKENYEDFVQSPVPVFFFQKIEKAVSQAWIEKIEKVDWSDMPQLPWMYMSRKEFAVYLKKKLPGIPTALMNPLHLLRKNAQEIFRPGLPATQDFLLGKLCPIFALRSQEQRIIAIIPFLMRGYREDEHLS